MLWDAIFDEYEAYWLPQDGGGDGGGDGTGGGDVPVGAG